MAIEIVKDYLPGSIGRVAEIHAAYYSREAGFGLYFESKVACELSEFLCRYNKERDGIWFACSEAGVEGSIAIDGVDSHTEGAHLRWFIVSDAIRNKGNGNRLITAALDFCREKKHKKVYLWTFEGLDAARHLYEKYGFRLTRQERGMQWGSEVNEQLFELWLSYD